VKIADLKTPCALVDLDRIERNTTRMAKRMSDLGVNLRAHVKTHKTLEAAWMQVLGHSGGITVSTLAEAKFFAAAGFRDITWAFPLPPDRLEDVSKLTLELDRFHIVIDNAETLKAVQAFNGPKLSAFLKFDCGDHRAGVDPEDDESVSFAKRMSQEVDFAGILTHAGHSYESKDADAIRRVAAEERDIAVRFAKILRDAGVEVREVSIGSTPTMSVVDDLDGITEVRPGNYAFYDAFQAAIGSCSLEDAAFSVLATVVGSYASQNRFLINAGALAMSKDAGPRHVNPDCGLGVVCSPDAVPIGGLDFHDVSQEHGQVRGGVMEIGQRVRIVPNHACLASALFERYHVVRGDEVVGEWKPVRGW